MMSRITAQSEGTQRIIWLDALKGFAAILVVLGHDLGGLQDEKMFVTWEGFWNSLYEWIYSFHMSLFFLISGFLFFRAYCKSGSEETAAQRGFWVSLANLIWAYFVFDILLWCSRFLMSAYVSKQVSRKDLLLIPIVPMEVYWYLWVLIAYYLIGRLLFQFIIQRGKIHDGTWVLVALALSLSSAFVPFPGISNRVAYYAVAFFFGMYCGKNGFDCICRRAVVLTSGVAAVAATLMIFCIGWKPRNIPIVNTVSAMLFSIAFLNLAIYLGTKPRYLWLEKRLAVVGGSALEIYLLHLYFVGAGRRIVKALGVPVTVFSIMICTAVEAAVPMLLAWVLKKIGLHKLIFRPATWLYARKSNIWK